MKLGSFRTEIAATMPVQHYVKVKATEDARLHAAHNLDKYHVETKSWRDKKVIRKNIALGREVAVTMVQTFRHGKHDQDRNLSSAKR